MADAPAEVRERRGFSVVWLLPLLALLIGVWMLASEFASRGPEIEIVFSTAEGIEAGQTRIKVRNVEIGLVESVRLRSDLQSVLVRARLEKEAAELLRKDTQFWVVRARLEASGISGIDTLLSGGYIQVAPGSSDEVRRTFIGLEAPPVTPAGTPGLPVVLESEEAGSVGAGDPILYKGFAVGRIESVKLDVASQQIHYSGFIDESYASLVSSSTRFWRTSGIAVDATASGIELEVASLQTLLLGGVAFGMPAGIGPGEPVEPRTSFELYADYNAVNAKPYRHSLEYVVEFEQSIRGLRPGAPVEYRGVTVGRVERVLLDELAATLRGEGESIPVLILLEPGRLALPDSVGGNETLGSVVENSVAAGMRASLVTGNFLTGSQYVSLDIHERAARRTMGEYSGRVTIPTITGGFDGIEHELSALLATLNGLPIDALADSAADAVESVEQLLAAPAWQRLPASLEKTLADVQILLATVSENSVLQEELAHTLAEADRTLKSLRDLSETLREQPNAILFSREPERDPEPPSGSP